MTTLMQALAQLPAQPLAHALGWTLLHFCWQGTVVAAVLWGGLGLLGGRSSQARYTAACLALGLMVALPVATFAHIAAADLRARAMALASGVVLDANIVVLVGAHEPVPPWPARLAFELDHALPWVLLAWFSGVLVFVGRLNFGLMVARRLKTAGTGPASAALHQMFEELRIRLGVERGVELLHSARVQVPTVIGWLRPVVLLPVSCLTGLAPEQLEAVLCHELAHVRRHDYLVSVFQSMIETLLFYHPAVWWVSRQIRRERECCCDEFAVRAGGNVLAYARALSYLEENRAAFPEFVLGANGGVLKMRIKRLLGSKEDVAGSPYAAFVVLGLAAALAGSYFVAVSHAQAQAAQAETASAAEIASAATPSGAVRVTQEGTAAANPEQALHGVYKSWLEQDVLWIITPEERDAFLKLTNDEERDKFVEQFWARRDPPGTASGTAREEHYARIAYSNQHFASNTGAGWRSDRGHIYIVYGMPESIDSHPATGGTVSAFPYEVWHYKYIAGIGDNVDLAFVDTCQCGDYHYTIDPAEKYVDRSFTGPGLAKQESAQPANAAQISLAKKLLAPPSISEEKQDAAQQTTAAQGTGSISGTIVDPHGALVPRAHVTAINIYTGFRATIQSDSAGAYTTPPLPAGTYDVDATAPGLAGLRAMNIKVESGQTVGLNLKMIVGMEMQSLTVAAKAQPPSPPPPPVASAQRPIGPQRVSSGVMQGLILSQPQPIYPEDAKAQHIQGVVVLHARISKEGTIKDLQLIGGPPALVVSAIDAVRQWKYKPFLVDGDPTEVDTVINVHYTLAGEAEPPAGGTQAEPHPATPPMLIYKVDPEFSAEARQQKIGGVVLVGATVNLQGVADNVRVVRGIGHGLDEKAVEAVKQYRFKPATENGVPVPKDINIEVDFKIMDSPDAKAVAVMPPSAPVAPVAAPAESAPAEYNGEPVRKVGGGVTAPKVIQTSEPEYSKEAKKAKFKGIVLVNLIVDANGLPQNVHVVRGVGMGLDQKAIDAVKQYKFKPAMQDGKPVPVELNVEVNFQIF